MDIVKTLMDLGVNKLLMALLTLLAGFIVVKYLMKLVDKALKRSRTIDPAMHSMFKGLLKCLLYFVVVLMTAATVGISITSILALFSVVGLAVSLAVQGVLSNLAGGVIILSTKMFTLGDFIEADAISGTVQEITFLHTRLKSPDGKIIYVPNSLLHSARVINYTANGMRRVDVPVSASYDNSPAEVKAAILDLLYTLPTVQQEPAPAVTIDGYGDNAINYVARFWAKNEDYWPTRHAVMEGLYDNFKEHGIEMTYPHLNVHMN